MITTPLVSVIVPCYNGELYLRQAIDSALAQTYPRVEVVVVDDGSADGSADIAESYGDRILLVRQENAGLSAARNAAIEASSGEFVCLLDADDVLLPDCISSRLRHALEDESVGLVAGYYREIDGAGNVLPRVPEIRRVTEMSHFYQAVKRNWGPPVGWIIRRRAIELCGDFDPLLRSCEDWDLLIRLTTKYRIAYEPTTGAYYRQLEGQMSRNHLVMYDAGAKVLAKNAAFARSQVGYWWWSQFGRFQHGRRIIWNVLSERRGGLARLVFRRPALLWIGFMGALSFLAGKRATHKNSDS
jgi:glycosyltransferase involved in cell wall biosynthesis